MLDLRRYLRVSSTLRDSWERDGYLHLKGVLSATEVQSVLNVVDDQWSNRDGNPHEVDLLTGPLAGASYTISNLPASTRDNAYKLNNLFLNNEKIRRAALNPYLRKVLQTLLGVEPVICNSLNFERGSQQPSHIDSWFMPSPDGDGLVAASIALERVDEDNGPIFFYPGSHNIAPYIFSDGRLNMAPAEEEACNEYLRKEIDRLGLNLKTYSADAGDVLIWHGQLIHGGSAIRDFSRTRNSLVVHYWRASAVDPHVVRCDRHGSYLAHTLRGELSPV